jgi:16S rRNA (cytosine967-C5)-methyltransferase
MTAAPARRIAFDVLRRVEADGAYATDALNARLVRGTKRADAGLATELVLGVLRWRRLLDFLIEREAGRSVASLDLEVLLALRLAIYQLQFLSRVPAAAAVNDSVELVKLARKRSASGLVNAVLRKAARELAPGNAAPREGSPHPPHPQVRMDTLVPADLPLAERLGITLSHPTWLVERWLARFGEEATRSLLEANNRPPRMTAVPLGRTEAAGESRDDANASLAAEGFAVTPGRWLRAAIELRGVPQGGTAAAKAFQRGGLLIQDEASQMIPLLLGARPGLSILDLCAAPGGKTARLAQQAGESAIVATDRHLHRLRQMREFLHRAGVRQVALAALDATAPLPFVQLFDRILVDAPCSGTGTLARNPEIRWRLRPEDLTDLAEKQTALLRNALGQLAPGGRLVYSTCSMEPEENERVVAAAMAGRPNVAAVSGAPALAPHLRPGAAVEALFDEKGNFRTLPWVHETDGFYAAVMELR